MSKPSLRTSVAVAAITAIVLSYQACGQATQFSDSSQEKGTGYNEMDKQPGEGGTTTDNPKATVNLMVMSYSSSDVRSADLCVKEVRFNSPMTGMHIASVSQKSSSYKDKDCDKKSKDKSGKKSNSLIGSILGALFGSHDSGASRSDSAPSSSDEMDAPFDEEAYVTTPENPQQSVVPEGSGLEQFQIPPNTYTSVEIELKPGCATGALKINKSGVSITSSENGLVIRFEGNIVVKNSGDLKLDIQKIIEALQNADDAEDIKTVLSKARGSLQ